MSDVNKANLTEALAKARTERDHFEAREKPRCPYGNMPREAGAGHWRDWHRGHGCHLDPNIAGGAK